MAKYIDDQIIEDLHQHILDSLKDAVKFATTRRANQGDCDESDLRQVAQEAAEELLNGLVETVYEAYRRGVGNPDGAGIAKMFEKYSVTAELRYLDQRDERVKVRLHMPSGTTEGEFLGLMIYEGQPCAHLKGDSFTPLSAITRVELL